MITWNSFSIGLVSQSSIRFQHELLRLVYERTNGSTHGLSTSLLEELDRFYRREMVEKKKIKKMKLEKNKEELFFSEVA